MAPYTRMGLQLAVATLALLICLIWSISLLILSYMPMLNITLISMSIKTIWFIRTWFRVFLLLQSPNAKLRADLGEHGRAARTRAAVLGESTVHAGQEGLVVNV